MSEIKKLSNVQYTITDEVINRLWSEVYAKRSKLLQTTDWTQLADCDLPQNIRNLWRTWRQKIRNVKKSSVTNPKSAMDLLDSLEKQSPEKIIIDMEVPQISNNNESSIDQKLSAIKSELLEKIVSTTNIQTITATDVSNLIAEHISRLKSEILSNTEDEFPKELELAKHTVIQEISKKLNDDRQRDELFHEAIDYIDNPNGKYPLLKVHAQHFDKSLDEITTDIINERKQLLKQYCQRERIRLQYLDTIQNAQTVEEIQAILLRIKEVTWTLI